MDLFTILWFGASTFLILFISPLIGCGGKKPAAAGADGAVGADGKPAVPTKACNTKSGLLNDTAPASGAGGGEKEPGVATKLNLFFRRIFHTFIPNLQSNIPMPTTPASMPYDSDLTAAAYITPPFTSTKDAMNCSNAESKLSTAAETNTKSTQPSGSNEEDGDYENLTQDENNKNHQPLAEIVQTPGGQFVKTTPPIKASSNKNINNYTVRDTGISRNIKLCKNNIRDITNARDIKLN
uniref:Uncharacterized protein n=1 Tax=Panagrolaimus sp. PS1159 TaxID=55785 RepID=A0AC35GIQ2_9BILA